MTPRYRRTIWIAALVTAFALLLGAGCGDDEGDDEDTAPTAGARTFLAVPPDGTNEVVVATLLDDGTFAAYICDSLGTGEFFEGPVENDRVSLESERGAQLTAQVSEESISGEYTLGPDETVEFSAKPEPEAGIYLLTFSEDGSIEGEGTGGGTAEGEVDPERFTLSATYPSGDSVSIEAKVVKDVEGTDEAESVEAGGLSAQGEPSVYAEQATERVTEPGEFDETRSVKPAELVAELAGASFRFNIVRGVLLGRSTTEPAPYSWRDIDL